MLNDAERRRLAEIESELQAHDPALARLFAVWQDPIRRRINYAFTVLVVVVGSLAVILTALSGS
jgi:Protein of unknown function (DUF3040)